jgi:Fic family protein
VAHFVRKTFMTADLSLSRNEMVPACEYNVYIPDPLVGRSFEFTKGCEAEIAEAEAAIHSLNINAKTLFRAEGLARLLLRAEAAASSVIEGLEIPVDRVLRAEAAREFKAKTRRDFYAREVLGNVDAMVEALDAAVSEPKITLDSILRIHHRLMVDTLQKEIAGVLRSQVGWIGGNPFDPCGARFVPPPADEIPGFLADVADFCNDTSLSPVAHAAIVHAQFETIHPFPDGNGRVGRALIHLILRRRGLAPCWCTPVSLVLATLRKDYADSLLRFSYDGRADTSDAMAAVNDWVAFFARACTRSVHDAHIFEQRVREVQTMWRERLLREELTATVDQLIDTLPGTAIMTVGSASRVLGRSFAEAKDAIDTLARVNVLHKVRVAGGGVAFEATEIITAFTQLERRLASPMGDTYVSPPVRAVPRRRD